MNWTNRPKTVHIPIFWGSIPCVFCWYTLSRVVSHYDLSVLSRSVMGLKKVLIGGWGELDPFFLEYF